MEAKKSKRQQRSASEELQRLRHKTSQLQLKMVRDEIMAYLEHYPEQAPGCLQYLKDACGGKSPPKKRKPAVSDFDGEKGRDTPSPKDSGSSAHSDELGDLTRPDIPKCYTTVGSIPPKYLFEVVGKVGEISLSKNSMRALCSKGAKMPSKEKLMELFEGLSGMEPEDGLRSDLHRMEALALGVRLRYHKMDRWARDVVLPCNWVSDGHYELKIVNGEAAHPAQAQHS